MSKRKCLTAHDKIKVIEEIDNSAKKKLVAQKYGIPADFNIERILGCVLIKQWFNDSDNAREIIPLSDTATDQQAHRKI